MSGVSTRRGISLSLLYHPIWHGALCSLGLYKSAVITEVLQFRKFLREVVGGDETPIPFDGLDSQIASNRAGPPLGAVCFWPGQWLFNQEGEGKVVKHANNFPYFMSVQEGFPESIGVDGLCFRQWDDIARGVPSMTT